MLGTSPFAIVAAALAYTYLQRFCAAPASLARSVVKTGSVLALALAAGLAGGPVALIVALCLCALGDCLLSRETEPTFLAGVAAFAGGHVAYVVLFLTHPLARPEVLSHGTPMLLIGALLILGGVMAMILWRRAGHLRVPVMIYIPVILSMGIAVLTLPSLGPLAFAAPAATLFILSDVTLALELFVFTKGRKPYQMAPYIVWPTYWLAQLGLCLAFALLPPG